MKIGMWHVKRFCSPLMHVEFYLEFILGVGLTLGVVCPASIALWVMEPLAIRITHFGDFLC